MLLIKAGTADFEKIKNAYIDIAENTPDIDKYARYEYGKHPNDEEITEYIADGNMYMLMDHDTVAGVIAMTTFQGEEYHPIKWKIRTLDDEVMVLHLLGIVPSYQGTDVYSHIIDDDRKRNAALFEEAFYGKQNLDPTMHAKANGNVVSLPTDVDAPLLAKVLSNPEMAALLTTLAKTLESK